jgi:hypothetical protein
MTEDHTARDPKEDEDFQKERQALADELDLPINDPRLDEYIAREQGLL